MQWSTYFKNSEKIQHTLGTVHSHKWKNGKRENEHFPLSQADKKKYKNAIEEATGRKDLIWEWK